MASPSSLRPRTENNQTTLSSTRAWLAPRPQSAAARAATRPPPIPSERFVRGWCAHPALRAEPADESVFQRVQEFTRVEDLLKLLVILQKYEGDVALVQVCALFTCVLPRT